MKFTQKANSIMLAVSIAISMLCSTAYADENTTGPNGALPNQPHISLEQQLNDILMDTSLTDAEKTERAEKINHLIELQNGIVNSNSRATIPTTLELTVQFHSQLYGDYCGPATTQQTYEYLYYMKNNRYYAPSQTTIAGKIGTISCMQEKCTTAGHGTSIQDILDYLNDSNLGCSYSSVWWWANQNGFDTMVEESISDKTPVILYASISSGIAGRSNLSDRSKWLFATGGHFLNISGYNFKNSSDKYFNVTDPFADRFKGYSSGKYDVNNSVVKAATNCICV